MTDMQPSTLQIVFNWIIAVIGGLLSVIVGISAWIFKRFADRVDSAEIKIARMASREELAEQMRILHEERLRMHGENRDQAFETRAELRDMRKEQGRELRTLNQRVDELLKR
jgi:membrane protein implicated in regulation of membrane protease activity